MDLFRYLLAYYCYADMLLVLNLVGQSDFMASLQRLGGLPIARCKLSSCDLGVYQSGTEMEYWKAIA